MTDVLKVASALVQPTQLSIVIPSFNVRPVLDACLRSIYRCTSKRSYEVIVVDNASRDDTVEFIRREHPIVRVVANATNRGFGQAANQGFDLARGELVLLLNPDTTVGDGTIDRLADALLAEANVGVVGPLTRYPDGRHQSTRRRFPTPLLAMIESTQLQQWFPHARPLARYYVTDRPDERQDVDWLVGSCLLLRRAVVQEVGGFDERFFMYSEELDWCRRVRQVGWRVVYVPEAELVHHEGRSSEQNVANRASNFQESKSRYFEKYYGAGVGRALRIYLLADSGLELAFECAKLALGHRPVLRWRRVKALLALTRRQVLSANGRT